MTTSSCFNQRFVRFREKIKPIESSIIEGKLTRIVGLTLEAVGCNAPIGSHCLIVADNGVSVEAEVVGFSDEKTYLMPTSHVTGLTPGAKVISTGDSQQVGVGDNLLGRIIGASGEALDGKAPVIYDSTMPLYPEPINPLNRNPINTPLDVGVRSINGILALGRGQRIGLFAGSGIGKSMLLGMMTKYTEADIVVVALIGERGREVKEFIEDILGQEGLKKSIVIAVPADNSPLMRIRGSLSATSIAEYFRDKGENVLLLMDSLTRFAQAQREIALAIGEPPATKGYPPSVFSKLPQLIERTGNGLKGKGSITAVYTVLAEGDDQQDPIVDCARAVLDGHIVLARKLAEAGHYPAIDIEASISRVMPNIVDAEQMKLVLKLKSLYAKYNESQELLQLGAYTPGSDPNLDMAISLMPKINNYLTQEISANINFSVAFEELKKIFT